MKIEREHASQRRFHRLNAPLYIKLDDQDPIKAADWSLGGLAIAGVQGKLPKIGETLSLGLSLPFQGYDISFDAEVEVVRHDVASSLIGCQFSNLSERSHDLLNYFTEDLIRGHMGSVEDSICRIDVPVTPISTKPTTNHISETPIHRVRLRTVIMSLFYVLFGLFVFTYLGILIYSNFMRLEVTSSVVSSQLQILKMPMDGEIRAINFKEGDQVAKGGTILAFGDRKLESQISAAKLKVSASKKSVWKLQQKYKIEKERLKLYQIVSQTDKNIARARLVSLRVALNAADENFLRMARLLKSGAISTSRYEQAKKNQAIAASKVQEAELLLEKNSAMAATSNRRHFNHKEFVVDLDLLAVDIEMAYSALELEERKLQYLVNVSDKRVLRAPYDGKIVNLYHSASTNITRNEPLLLFERNDEPKIIAYLNQSEILEIGLHDEAKIFVPAINKYYSALVTKIDRHSSYINKNETEFTWRDEKARTAIVTLRLVIDRDEYSQIRTGLPVVVIFNRWETSDIWSRLKVIAGIKSNLERSNESYREM